jgi:hypothetical protein
MERESEIGKDGEGQNDIIRSTAIHAPLLGRGSSGDELLPWFH